MALDTTGFNFAIPQQGIVTPALANVAPYSPTFRGMEFKPFDIKPPSTAVAQGLAAALGSIGQGIQVAYTNERQEQAQQRKDAIEQQRLGLESHAQQRKDAIEQQRLGLEGQKLQWEMQHGQQVQEDKEAAARLKSVTPLDFSKVPSFSQPTYKTPEAPKPTMYENLLNQMPPTSSPVELKSPKVSEASEWSQNPYDTLKNITPESIKVNYTTMNVANAPVGSKADVPSAVSGMVSDKNAITPPTQEDFLKNAADELKKDITSGGPLASQAAQFQTNPMIEELEGVKYPMQLNDALRIRDYYKAKGDKYPPQIVESTHSPGNVELEWVKPETKESQLMREETAKGRTQTQENAQQLRYDNQVKGLANSVNQLPAVKNFTGANGLQQMFPRAFITREEAHDHPMQAGPADAALFDLFVRAQTGSIPREAQLRMMQQGLSLPDKLKIMGMKVGPGGLLDNDLRDQMQRIVAKDYGVQANLANQGIELANQKLKAWAKKHGQEVDDNDLGKPYILPEYRDQVESRKKEIEAKHASMLDTYKSIMSPDGKKPLPGKEEQAKALSDALRQSGEQIDSDAKKLAKTKSPILNFEDILNTPQGMIGAGGTLEISGPGLSGMTLPISQ
jgi:hypothetical protein